jgi:chemotaxis protein MotB
MGAPTNVAPVIIKRKKVVAGGGHHGGAWKVAYADFVTAMMAFFMLMWLLNATTETQRKGLADYFSPTIPIHRMSGGGDGSFGGESVFSEDTLPQNGTGATNLRPTDGRQARGPSGMAEDGIQRDDGAGQDEEFELVEDMLFGHGGESMVTEQTLRHIVTRVTDEGLVIELFDLDGVPLFRADTDDPTPLMRDLAAMLVGVMDLVSNAVAVEGHVRAHPVTLIENPVWPLSSARAARTRMLLESAGMNADRVRRVTGHADREPAVRNPMAVRNNRVEVILLRQTR